MDIDDIRSQGHCLLPPTDVPVVIRALILHADHALSRIEIEEEAGPKGIPVGLNGNERGLVHERTAVSQVDKVPTRIDGDPNPVAFIEALDYCIKAKHMKCLKINRCGALDVSCNVKPVYA